MPRKPKAKAEAPTAKSTRSFLTVGKLLAGLLVFAGIVAGIILIGQYAGDRVKGDSRYEITIHQISFNKPRHVDVDKFTREVQALGNLPDKINIHDEAMHARLRTAFGKHPWVAREPVVSVTQEGVLKVQLDYRKPTVAVSVEGLEGWRSVDGLGILLPAEAPLDDLPKFANRLKSREIVEGRPITDPILPAAIDVLKLYPGTTIERTDTTWRITQSGGSVKIINLGNE